MENIQGKFQKNLSGTFFSEESPYYYYLVFKQKKDMVTHCYTGLKVKIGVFGLSCLCDLNCLGLSAFI